MAGKFLSKVNLDSMWVPKQAMNHVSEQQRKSESERIRVKDKVSDSGGPPDQCRAVSRGDF